MDSLDAGFTANEAVLRLVSTVESVEGEGVLPGTFAYVMHSDRGQTFHQVTVDASGDNWDRIDVQCSCGAGEYFRHKISLPELLSWNISHREVSE